MIMTTASMPTRPTLHAHRTDETHPTDYARVERAIRWLVAHQREQPALDDVAKAVGLSPSHFQRLFTRWAGVSPKRFLQYQTIAEAKALLRADRPVLDTAYEVGMSGGGRLHDLFVQVEAMTPGEYASGAEGLVIRQATHRTPFGDCLVAVTDRGICALTFRAATGGENPLAQLKARWPGARFVEDAGATRGVAEQVFGVITAGAAAAVIDAPPVGLSVLLKGTNLQMRVWRALLKVPAGTVVSYEDLAAAIGSPSAVRAVANAVARNPIHYLIPCHRVIRKSGELGGYAGGVERKRAMLGVELGRWAQEPAA
jgi:AraC family transcriptional regulator of adaptative response/methylated-DNA-[protein]-cysteine methyltransferase